MKWDPVASLANLRHEEIASLFDFLENTQFWIKDKQGRYLRVNRAFHLNYSIADPADVVGLTDFDLSPPYLARQFHMQPLRRSCCIWDAPPGFYRDPHSQQGYTMFMSSGETFVDRRDAWMEIDYFYLTVDLDTEEP